MPSGSGFASCAWTGAACLFPVASGPGTFRSHDSVDPYRTAFDASCRFAGLDFEQHAWEIALSREGYRAGSVVVRGENLWFLLLPSKPKTEKKET